jgi:PhnB protein
MTVENSDKVFAKAVKLGAAALMPVTDMPWGDRCGSVADPDGNTWMIATHTSEPTPAEMKKKMKEQANAQAASATA